MCISVGAIVFAYQAHDSRKSGSRCNRHPWVYDKAIRCRVPSFVNNADYAEPLLGVGSVYTDDHILSSICLSVITILFQGSRDYTSRVCRIVGLYIMDIAAGRNASRMRHGHGGRTRVPGRLPTALMFIYTRLPYYRPLVFTGHRVSPLQRFSIDHRRWPEPASGAIVERWLIAMRHVMKEHWCTRFVRCVQSWAGRRGYRDWY
jgi:hypothetical protein